MAKKQKKPKPEQTSNSWAALKRSLQDVVLQRRSDRFDQYGADRGDYEPSALNQIRFMNALSTVSGMLTGYEQLGATYEDIDAIYKDPEHFTAEQALRDFRELEVMLEDVSDLARTLPQSDKLKEIQVALCMIDLGQMDLPVESAMLDGHEEAAIGMLQEAVLGAYEQVGYRLSQLATEYSVYEWGQVKQPGHCEKAADNKEPEADTFSFVHGQVIYHDGSRGAIELRTQAGFTYEVFKKLGEARGTVVPYHTLDADGNRIRNEATDALRRAKSRISKVLSGDNIPWEVKSIQNEGYILRRTASMRSPRKPCHNRTQL